MRVVPGHAISRALGSPFHGARTLFAILLVGLAGSMLHLGGLWALAGAALIVAGLVIVTQDFTRIAAAEQVAIGLCREDDVAPANLAEALDSLERRMAQIGYRSAARNPATGLPTREHLFARLEAELLHSGPTLLGVVRMADYDRLAAFDQQSASKVLATFATQLEEAIGQRHALAQVDRDCFAIWFGSTDLATAVGELRALAYVAARDIETPEGSIAPAIEVGSASAPRDGATAEQLLARALATLARPSETPLRSETSPHSAPLEQLQERFVIEQGLERAIAENQLSMLFQPLVDLDAGRIVGAEALLRWRHPSLGPIPPSRFIPIIEAIGLSDRYGLWVLDAACRQVRSWREGGLCDFKVAVNLSARQLHDDALPVKINRTLARHGLPSSALELELTETAAMADIDRTRALFDALHAMGLSIAIDDFGSGYSSLSYLKNLRFDKLKIDREFVTGVDSRRDSRAICEALIALGRGLDLVILAEGVETPQEVETLHGLGCTLFQGYHFAGPLEGDALAALAHDEDWTATLRSRERATFEQFEERISA